METKRTLAVASAALLGGEGARLDADFAIAGIGISPPRLRHADRMIGVGRHGHQPG